ncbi:RNA polymerase factor sigma-54 [Sphingomonas sp. CGMCC 1.13654]|uniref:RNA polymerase sigma-54 factor n=1 Tax=Sphingomonas chungangi TaxID=2683589 RepID=A0A838L3J6_9SPHN|nr:RNA polymerase factor sigma-54 [Sphingomonas chungangi]MBA2934053.1 RNA polymerase factor sigma-54 [Sphingomonas chungangi]MVW57799.1 RNA polymerase factor sigma-54 [Sphingomonas chungangi]
MSLAPRLDLRQSQSLVMTPQLQQAIKLLALSNLEIEAFIAEELEKNPLLDSGSTEEVREAEPDGDFDGDAPEPTDALAGLNGGGEDAPLDVDYSEETFHHDSPSDLAGAQGMDGSLGLAGTATGGGEGGDLQETLAGAENLSDHLMAQAGTVFSGDALLIAGHIIDALDDAGYLTVPLLDIAERLGAPLGLVERVLGTVQTFDPTGIGARDLAECLALQAKEADRYDPCMEKLIAHLDILARGDLPRLRRICGVDEEDMADMIRELRAYDPKPGLQFAATETQPVVPDIFVAPMAKGGWAVELNNATLPRLIVNRSYYAELASAAGDRTSKAWLNDSLQSANWLMKALDQRARTIVKVATEIVKQQEAFFQRGVEHLRPLTLRTIAEAIGMHESTVSRVTSNKYLACPRGLFELKFFFTSAIQSADGGEAASAQAVKSHIARLIADEAPDDILSDDALVDLLKERGFDIARRTVAKYREALGLGSSVQRRRQKKLAG